MAKCHIVGNHMSWLKYICYIVCLCQYLYNKTCVKRPLSKRPKTGFQDQLLLNAGQKYCRMLQGEHSAILFNFIKLPLVIKIFVVSILCGCIRQVLLYIFAFTKSDFHVAA